jgi:hypothetical protein
LVLGKVSRYAAVELVSRNIGRKLNPIHSSRAQRLKGGGNVRPRLCFPQLLTTFDGPHNSRRLVLASGTYLHGTLYQSPHNSPRNLGMSLRVCPAPYNFRKPIPYFRNHHCNISTNSRTPAQSVPYFRKPHCSISTHFPLSLMVPFTCIVTYLV